MGRLHKKIVTDETGKPLAVQIAYADWLVIEQELASSRVPRAKVSNLAKHSGVLSATIDPLEYQKAIRGEWR